jgi:GH24 family phage-related lysozyme (muramidase)
MINVAGAELLTLSEGIRLKAYLCPAGVPTIGRGHTHGITHEMVRSGYTITAEQERELFRQDMEEWEAEVRASLKRQPNENQLAAFINFAFNIGLAGFRSSTALTRFEAGDVVGCAEAMKWWNKITLPGTTTKVVSDGLVSRRAREVALFLTPVGVEAPMPQQVVSPELAAVSTGGFKMPAFLLAAVPALLNAIPKLVSIFGSDSERSQKNLKAVEAVVDIAKAATGATNAQDLIERLERDPSAVTAVKSAVESQWFVLTQLVEVGGGIAEARKANAGYMIPGAPPFWSNPAFVVSMALLAMPFMMLVDFFYVHPELYAVELRTQIVTGILAVILVVAGYWLGTSISSSRKTELSAADNATKVQL